LTALCLLVRVKNREGQAEIPDEVAGDLWEEEKKKKKNEDVILTSLDNRRK